MSFVQVAFELFLMSLYFLRLIYNKNELWNKRPMGITTEESNLNQMKLDSDLEKRKNALTR